MKTVARLENVSQHFGATVALKDITLSIPARCMVGLIGPDGVGKSSLLSLISGARVIEHGNIMVLGGDMSNVRHRQDVCPKIAWMPQGLGKNLYHTLSVYENVDFFARLFGHDKAERDIRINELLQSTGLAPFRDRPAGKLSGGMKQKLGLCCALIHDPQLLILDEPTTGVDPLSRAQFWDLIDSIRQRQPEMSVLVATAYMEEAERFDWLVAMNAGEVLATGSADELKAHTASQTLEQAFIALLPEAQRLAHKEVIIPPRNADESEIAIEARGLTMRFGQFVAVDHVNFRIARGEIFGFLGSNGCGKSTTMKMLTGLLPASEGEAWLFGQPVDPRDIETRRRVGYMSQAFSLYSELTVRQNLELHARLFHIPDAEIPGRIAEMSQRFTTHVTTSDTLKGAIAALPGIASIKIPGPAKNDVARRVQSLRRQLPAEVTIGISGDACAADGLNAGCEVWYSVCGGLFPHVAKELAAAATRGEAQRAEAISARLEPLWTLYRKYGGSLRVTAAAATILGLCGEDCLPRPLLPLSPDAFREIAETLRSLNLE